ncbi:MAG TPA: alpha/beta hydrolase [Acidimicrobiia bacterium]|nr:alpha/beta hydrolase [Acidimicrobiia bacterium]
MTEAGKQDQPKPRAPLEALDALAREEVLLAPGLRHVEIYTMQGLLTILWHGPVDAAAVVLMSGGAMGGLLGPAGGLYHDLGVAFAEQGIATMRVGYRRANDLGRCVHDIAAAADLASRTGAQRFVTVGHSFGGAVAVQAGMVLGPCCAGIVTLSTQSAGCEDIGALRSDVPLLLLHGDRDELLPPETSAVVQMLAGRGEVEILPGAGHLLTEAHDELRARLGTWIPERLDALAR